jgi:hypothetical protein
MLLDLQVMLSLDLQVKLSLDLQVKLWSLAMTEWMMMMMMMMTDKCRNQCLFQCYASLRNSFEYSEH